MFNLINIGERAGSGIPNIYSVWEKSGWEAPIITESFSPDRIQFSLAIKKSAIKNQNKELIIDFLTRNVSAKASEIAEILDLKPSRTRDYLSELIADGVIVAEGSNRNRTYKLR